MQMDPTFFNNHDPNLMMTELAFAKSCKSSFKIQCWISTSNELLMKQYHNLVFLNDTIQSLVRLDKQYDIINLHYAGGYGQYLQVVRDLMTSAQAMILNIERRWFVLIQASIVLRDVKNEENEMCLRAQAVQRRARAYESQCALLPFTQPRPQAQSHGQTLRPQIQISIV